MNIKTSNKQFWYLFTIILIPMIIIGFYSYENEKKRIIDTSSIYVKYAIDTKEDLLKRLFEQHKVNINNLKRTVKLLRTQHRAYIDNIQYTKIEQLNSYINSVKHNLKILSSKEEMITLFSRLNKHKNISRFASQYLPYLCKDMNIDKIYLVNKEGIISASNDSSVEALYPIYKLTKTLKDAWKHMSSLDSNEIYFADFSKKSTDNKFAAFAMIKVYNDNYLVISLSREKINEIIQFRTDSFSSIESYLIGYLDNKYYLRNDRIIKSKQKLGDLKYSLQIKKAHNSESGIDVKIGSTGKYELAAYAPIKYPGLDWSIHTTMSYNEVLSPTISGEDIMNEFIVNFGYYDLFFIDKYGTVFYTIKHESDYMKNIYNGDFSKTHFARTIRDTIINKKQQISKFEPYGPSNNKKAGFISTIVFDENREIELIVALQIPFESMTKIMSVGLTDDFKTHSFLIDADYKVLVDSDDNIEIHNKSKDFMSNIKEVINLDDKKVIIKTDKNNNKNLVMQSTICIEKSKWHLFVEIPYAQIQERLYWIALRIIVSILAIVIVSIFFLWRFTTMNKKHAYELESLAYNDILTDLPNRSFFLKHLEHSLNRSKRDNHKLAILFIDLDHFKYINDSYGHASGDNVLIEAASRLKRSIRKEDFVARIGGDEFIVLLNNMHNYLEIEIVAQKINIELAKPIKDDFGHVYHIGCSIGISLYPDDSKNAEKLIAFSDTAMYKAKESGRNQHAFYESKITNEAKEKVTLLNDLTQAIENDEFIVYYQPQINPKTSKLVAAEALVRWQHPTKGLLFPDSFIMMAEESRKIIDLGTLVLKKACGDFLYFKEQGIELEHISVNISSKQLFSKGFVDEIIDILDEFKLEAKYLELEITETSMVENIIKAVKIIEELNAHGVRFSIDDFGTGFSSLEYLKKLKVNTLKIDRTFVMDVPYIIEDIAIVNAVIYMANEFGFEIVAEGVETKQQLDFLTTLTQKLLIQGYYYSKPITKEEFIATYKI